MIPIICIGNNHIDKKMKELMKNCVSIKLYTPTSEQIGKYMQFNYAKYGRIFENKT